VLTKTSTETRADPRGAFSPSCEGPTDTAALLRCSRHNPHICEGGRQFRTSHTYSPPISTVYCVGPTASLAAAAGKSADVGEQHIVLVLLC
jgi:hypothetical protein